MQPRWDDITASCEGSTFCLHGSWWPSHDVRVSWGYMSGRRCSSAPSELLALMALRAKESVLSRNMSIIRTNLGLLDTFFESQRERFLWRPPLAGSIAFPRLLTGGWTVHGVTSGAR
jgi:hypothetical protein